MSRMMKRFKGFTFVETVLAIVIVGIIASVAAQVLVVGLNVYALIINRNNAFQTARLAMDRMVDEIVLIGTSNICWFGCLQGTYFGFQDSDGYWTDFHKTTYTTHGQSAPCLNRGGNFLAGEVTSLAFRYYQLDGTTTTSPLFVRRFNIEFVVTAPASAGSIRLRTDVFPRNFMYSNFL